MWPRIEQVLPDQSWCLAAIQAFLASPRHMYAIQSGNGNILAYTWGHLQCFVLKKLSSRRASGICIRDISRIEVFGRCKDSVPQHRHAQDSQDQTVMELLAFCARGSHYSKPRESTRIQVSDERSLGEHNINSASLNEDSPSDLVSSHSPDSSKILH